jgi:ribosome-binding factor A
MTQRTERIDALLREEIGAIVARDLADPAIGFTTVTDVETAPDLGHAQVWVSLIGQPDERTASLAALRRALPYVRRLLGERVRLRRIPELHLRVDETAERGTRVLRLLAELEAGATPNEPTPTTDSLPTPVRRLPHEGDAPEGEAREGEAPGAGDAGDTSPAPPASRGRRQSRGRGEPPSRTRRPAGRRR